MEVQLSCYIEILREHGFLQLKELQTTIGGKWKLFPLYQLCNQEAHSGSEGR